MQYEAIVIGAGPAGLTAALYLARYKRTVLAVHDNNSRALRIPTTHNAPGFPDGISGPDLIQRMSAHAREFGAVIQQAEIVDIKKGSIDFELKSADGAIFQARSVILAGGIFLNQVDLPHDVHEQAIEDDVLRYCPVCDGYEHSDKKIGVIGCDSDGAAEALFLRQFSADITLMPLSHPELSNAQKREMEEAGIDVITGKLLRLEPRSDRMDVYLEGKASPTSFDVVYPALGCRPRTELAQRLGIALCEDGCMPKDALAKSCVGGFFGAGDVLEGLDQISVAMGHGAQAATNAHNWLREQDKHVLQNTD
jgi:thioredoxin reductase (NADPH)